MMWMVPDADPDAKTSFKFRFGLSEGIRNDYTL